LLLKAHRQTLLLPQELDIQSQERIYLIQDKALYLDIDLVFYNTTTGVTKYVLDTKYKAAARPAITDIYQIVTYAEAKSCQEAFLVYPMPLAEPLNIKLNIKVGNIQIRSLTFSLAGDLEKAGYRFLQDLLGTDVLSGNLMCSIDMVPDY